MNKEKILITGAHRSGSTWVAKVLAKNPKAMYIAEPFNISFDHPGNPLKLWFQYLRKGESYPDVERYINNRLEFGISGCMMEAPWLLKRGYVRAYWYNQVQKLTRPVKIIKDPIAIFSAPWLHEHFVSRVIVLIRHPAAFVASLKTKNWRFDCNEFLQQEALMDDRLFPFRGDLLRLTNAKHDLLDEGMVLWNAIYTVVREYIKEYPGWFFLKHEDISRDPFGSFKSLTSYTGMELTDAIRVMIEKSTNSGNTNDLNKSISDSIIRNSYENVKSWKSRLNATEINRIKVGCDPLWRFYYSESDW